MGSGTGDDTNWMIAMWSGGTALLAWIVIEYAIDGCRIWREKRKQNTVQDQMPREERHVAADDPVVQQVIAPADISAPGGINGGQVA